MKKKRSADGGICPKLHIRVLQFMTNQSETSRHDSEGSTMIHSPAKMTPKYASESQSPCPFPLYATAFGRTGCLYIRRFCRERLRLSTRSLLFASAYRVRLLIARLTIA